MFLWVLQIELYKLIFRMIHTVYLKQSSNVRFAEAERNVGNMESLRTEGDIIRLAEFRSNDFGSVLSRRLINQH